MAMTSNYSKMKNLAVGELVETSDGSKKAFDTKIPEIPEETPEKPVMEEPVETKPAVPEQTKTESVPTFKPASAPPVVSKPVVPTPKTQTFYPGQGSAPVPEAGEIKDPQVSSKITPERARLDTDTVDTKGQTSVLKGVPTVLVRSIQKLFPDMNQSDACSAFMYMFIKAYIPPEKLDEVPDTVKQNVLQYRGDDITSDTVMDYLKQNFDIMQNQFRDVKDENRELRRQLDAALLALSYLAADLDGTLVGSKMNFASASVDETYQRLMKDTKKAVQDRKNRDGRSY